MNTLQSTTEKFCEMQSNSGVFFAKLLELAKKNAHRKCIGKGMLYNIRPYQAQRAGFKLAKEIKRAPKNTKNIYIYHFDHKDNIILVEVYGDTENIINREFYFYSKNSIESVCFENSERIRNITLSSLMDDKFIQDINVGRYGSSTYTYKYSGKQVTLISVIQKEHDQNESSTFQILFDYSEGDLNRIIHSFPNGYQEQIFP